MKYFALLFLIITLLAQSAVAGTVLRIKQKTYNRGNLNVELADKSMRVTLGSGAQIFSAAPAWNVVISNPQNKTYCELPIQLFVRQGVHALTHDVPAEYTPTSDLTPYRSGEKIVCGHPADSYLIKFGANKGIKEYTNFVVGSVVREYPKFRQMEIASDLPLTRSESLILSTLYGIRGAYDSAILELDCTFTDGKKVVDVHTEKIEFGGNAPVLDKSIYKFKKMINATQVVYPAEHPEEFLEFMDREK